MSRIDALVVPAAGMGTRMLPTSYAFPKELLPIIDTPMIHHILQEGLDVGVRHVIMVVSSGKESIFNYFHPDRRLIQELRDKEKFQQAAAIESLGKFGKISLVYQDSPRGLGDAVLQARKLVGDEFFYVSLPDMLVPNGLSELRQAHEANPNCSAKLCLKSVDNPSAYGVAVNPRKRGDGLIDVESFVEKPNRAPSNLAILGRYVLSPKIWEILSTQIPGRNGEVQLTDAINRLEGDKLCAEIQEDVDDTGDPLGWFTANLRAALRHPKMSKEIRSIVATELSKVP
jgi:UTP--glucose-1-phosphate uridylyltransferase